MILRARQLLLAVSRWYVVIAMVAIIFGLSSLPNLAEPRASAFPFDKVAHFGEYSVLGFALAGSLRRDAPARWPIVVLLGVAIGAAALYGASDEFHQRFVSGRDVSFADWVADVTGSWAGSVASAVLVRGRELRREG
ncbi:MAG: antibiotic resistance protein VanZ [Dehalococcoidia bacterium]|nr:MAG: antibiotic resistance protein VanZ [Dehalococcoidia bacterium]